MKIAAVLPTRNRAALAAEAVRSLLDQDCAIEIFVSDNSTADDDALRTFCSGEPRAHYLRPEPELAMGPHWDWAVRQAMERSDATHFTVHYDRKYSRPRTWGAMAAAAAARPDMLVTYPVDAVSIDPPPMRLWQPEWTGKLYLLQSARIARMIAAGRFLETAQTLPVLANCLVPRAILDSIVARFGNVCDSIGPDYAFLARFFALHDRFLYYDRPLAVIHAPDRSAGGGFFRRRGGDFPDFQKTWGDRPWLFAAPIPGLTLGQNLLFHEYELVRRETVGRLASIELAGYLDELGRGLSYVEDATTRAELHRALIEHGWTGTPAPLRRHSPLARLRDRVMRFLIDRLHLVPSNISGFAFEDDATALRYALKYPRRRSSAARHLAPLGATEIPAA